MRSRLFRQTRWRAIIKPSSIWRAPRWEKRSKAHDKPNQVMGWQGGDTGSVVVNPDYQRMAGTWTDGRDPAGEQRTSTATGANGQR